MQNDGVGLADAEPVAAIAQREPESVAHEFRAGIELRKRSLPYGHGLETTGGIIAPVGRGQAQIVTAVQGITPRNAVVEDAGKIEQRPRDVVHRQAHLELFGKQGHAGAEVDILYLVHPQRFGTRPYDPFGIIDLVFETQTRQGNALAAVSGGETELQRLVAVIQRQVIGIDGIDLRSAESGRSGCVVDYIAAQRSCLSVDALVEGKESGAVSCIAPPLVAVQRGQSSGRAAIFAGGRSAESRIGVHRRLEVLVEIQVLSLKAVPAQKQAE